MNRLCLAPRVVPAVLLAIISCSGPSGDVDEDGRPVPGQALISVEDQLMDATASRVDFLVSASGSLEADLTGSLLLGEGGQARLAGEGTLRGQEVDLLLVSDGTRMHLSNGIDTIEAATPAALREALVVGFTRTGVTHNLLRLADLLPPDHAEGRADSWARTTEIRREERGNLAFGVETDREARGSVVLFMSMGTELPGERRETLSFGDGEAEVTETYSAISIGGGVEPADFALDGP
jgi:hypothetical protein